MGPRRSYPPQIEWSISIHPSRVGWDDHSSHNMLQPCHFNPPIPCGMGLMATACPGDYYPFQSTHPVWDGTLGSIGGAERRCISIHPSRVGWDCIISATITPTVNFNPPIPCGMGLRSDSSVPEFPNFNPPIPCGMGHRQAPNKRPTADINPPIPCGMGLKPQRIADAIDDISIHPSRVGWDNRYASSKAQGNISIHPSRVGWDPTASPPAKAQPTFQSTHPVWDGTDALQHRAGRRQYFNPPIPCGMGPLCGVYSLRVQ